MTPDGKVAIVRGNQEGDRLFAFNLLAGTMISISNNPQTQGADNFIADSVKVTNTRAIVVGSSFFSPTDSRTFVDILAIDTGVPSVAALQHYEFVDLGTVNDVAITPNGQKAVVTGDQRIRVFDLNNPLPTPYQSHVVEGGPWWTFTDASLVDWTDITADSVEVTNERAIVQFAKMPPANDPFCPKLRPIVHILNLTSPQGALATHDFFPDLSCTDRWPHDLAIDADYGLGIAVGVESLALYDIQGQFLWPPVLSNQSTPIGHGGSLFKTALQVSASFPIQHRSTVDSVVISPYWGDAIVIFPTQITVYDISSFTLNPILAVSLNEHAHDVALSGNGTKAGIRMENSCVVMNLVPRPPTSFTVPSSGQPFGSPHAFVADSVALSDSPPRAVFIANSVSLTGFGRLQVINSINGTSIGTVSVALDSATDRLVDVAVKGRYAFVRGSNSQKDFIAVDTCDATLLATFDLDGECMGLDHLEIAGNRVITVSENLSGGGITRGFVDIFSF